jgi:hypothetical protein
MYVESFKITRHKKKQLCHTLFLSSTRTEAYNFLWQQKEKMKKLEGQKNCRLVRQLLKVTL